MSWARFWGLVDWLARADFVGTLIGLVFDWRPWFAGIISGGGMTFLWAAFAGRAPLDVWVLAVFVAACFAVLIAVGIAILQMVAKSRSTHTAHGRPALSNPDKSSGLVDDKSRELAGLVNALMEAALSRTFKLPLPAGDIWVKRYEELRDSAHPIWSDQEANQLRREFLQYCGIVGNPLGNVRERESDRIELAHYGRSLMARLKGEPAPPKIENAISIQNRRIPLEKAVSDAYSAARGGALAAAAEEFGTGDKSALTWFADYFVAVVKIPIYGRMRHSQKIERVDASGFAFKMVEDSIIAAEIYGPRIWENMCVEPADLQRTIDRIKVHSSELDDQ